MRSRAGEWLPCSTLDNDLALVSYPIFFRARLSNPGVELVLTTGGGGRIQFRLSLLINAISDTIKTKGMRREIFFEKCFFFVRRRLLLPSCRACRSLVSSPTTTRSSNNGRPLFPSTLSSSLPFLSLPSPFPHPPLCKQPSLCPRMSNSLFSFSIRIACGISKIGRQKKR